MLLQALCIMSYPLVNSNWNYNPETPNLGQIQRFLEPCDLEFWLMTLKNNRAPLLCYFKLCASFRTHWWIQPWVTVRKTQFGSKSTIFFSRVTFKLDRWHRKTIGHLFYATSGFVHHFVPIGEFKLELQSGNAQFAGVEINDFISRVTFKLDGWPWKTIGHLFYDILSFVHHFNAIGKFKLKLQSGNAQFGQNRRFLEPCDLEIFRTTLKNNRTPLLCYFKLCASFRTHWWIQIGVTVRKRPIWVKFDNF